ncbi:MAG: hypothetical protein MI784_00020, partial [Cytophagales bacterium]|nr:hypothetical protein [Cytophagales bacterium]
MKIKCVFLFFLTLSLFLGCTGVRYVQQGEYILKKQRVRLISENKEIKRKLRSRVNEKPNKLGFLGLVRPGKYLHYWGENRFDSLKYLRKRQRIARKYGERITKTINDSTDIKKRQAQFRKKQDRLNLWLQEASETKERDKIERLLSRNEQKRRNNVDRLKKRKTKKIKKLTDARNREQETVERSLRNGNFWMRNWKAWELYDSVKQERVNHRLVSVLKGEGFFNARSSAERSFRRKYAELTYRVDPGKPYMIDSVWAKSANPVVDSLLQLEDSKKYLKKGERLVLSNVGLELERISRLMKNNGFYQFQKNRMAAFRIDTAVAKHKVWIEVEVNVPDQGKEFGQYRIDSVNFVVGSDQQRRRPELLKNRREVGGIYFAQARKRYKEKVLAKKSFLRSGELYSHRNVLATQLQLRNLEVFRTAEVRFDTSHNAFVANIFAEPKKKYQLTTELGLDFTLGQVNPFVNAGVAFRNPFRGLEVLKINAQAGLKGVVGLGDKISTNQESGVEVNLIFPHFLIPFPKITDKWGWLNQTSSLVFGYSSTKTNDYSLKDVNGRFAYSWQTRDRKKQFTVNWLEVGYIDSELTFGWR